MYREMVKKFSTMVHGYSLLGFWKGRSTHGGKWEGKWVHVKEGMRGSLVGNHSLSWKLIQIKSSLFQEKFCSHDPKNFLLGSTFQYCCTEDQVSTCILLK